MLEKTKNICRRDVIFTDRLVNSKTQESLSKIRPNYDDEITNQISEEENESEADSDQRKNDDKNTNSEEMDNKNLEKSKDKRRNEKYHLRERRQLKAPTNQDYEVYFCPNLPGRRNFLTYQATRRNFLIYRNCIKNKKWREAINEEKNSLIVNEV